MTLSGEGPSFTFQAHGHPRILASHPTTLEITTEDHLTLRGDCIVAVGATCGARGVPAALKEALSSDIGRAVLTIRAEYESFQVVGRGSTELTLRDEREMVVRKSGFISDRTLFIRADKAARDIPRSLVQLLQNPEQLVTIEIRAI
jgi:uncharacterized protein